MEGPKRSKLKGLFVLFIGGLAALFASAIVAYGYQQWLSRKVKIYQHEELRNAVEESFLRNSADRHKLFSDLDEKLDDLRKRVKALEPQNHNTLPILTGR